MPQELTLTAGYVKKLINERGDNSVFSIFEANNPLDKVKHLCDLLIERTNDESQSLLQPRCLNQLKSIILNYNKRHFPTTLLAKSGLNSNPAPLEHQPKSYIMSILAHYVYHALNRDSQPSPSLVQKKIITPYTGPTKFIKRQAPADYYQSLILQDLVTQQFINWQQIDPDDELITCYGYVINTSLARRSLDYQKALIKALLTKSCLKKLKAIYTGNDDLLKELIISSNATYWDGTTISSQILQNICTKNEQNDDYNFSVLEDNNHKPYIVDFKRIDDIDTQLVFIRFLNNNNISRQSLATVLEKQPSILYPAFYYHQIFHQTQQSNTYYFIQQAINLSSNRQSLPEDSLNSQPVNTIPLNHLMLEACSQNSSYYLLDARNFRRDFSEPPFRYTNPFTDEPLSQKSYTYLLAYSAIQETIKAQAYHHFIKQADLDKTQHYTQLISNSAYFDNPVPSLVNTIINNQTISTRQAANLPSMQASPLADYLLIANLYHEASLKKIAKLPSNYLTVNTIQQIGVYLERNPQLKLDEIVDAINIGLPHSCETQDDNDLITISNAIAELNFNTPFQRIAYKLMTDDEPFTLCQIVAFCGDETDAILQVSATNDNAFLSIADLNDKLILIHDRSNAGVDDAIVDRTMYQGRRAQIMRPITRSRSISFDNFNNDNVDINLLNTLIALKRLEYSNPELRVTQRQVNSAIEVRDPQAVNRLRNAKHALDQATLNALFEEPCVRFKTCKQLNCDFNSGRIQSLSDLPYNSMGLLRRAERKIQKHQSAYGNHTTTSCAANLTAFFNRTSDKLEQWHELRNNLQHLMNETLDYQQNNNNSSPQP